MSKFAITLEIESVAPPKPALIYAEPQFNFPKGPDGKFLALKLKPGESLELNNSVVPGTVTDPATGAVVTLPRNWMPVENEFVKLSAGGNLAAKASGKAAIEIVLDDTFVPLPVAA